jgi:type II secretory pathway pseudopilin PulG
MTLTETIVACLIISIAFLGVLSAYRGISTAILTSQTKQVAMALARERLEAMQAVPYYRLVAEGGLLNYSPDGPVLFKYDGTLETVQSGKIEYKRGAMAERMFRNWDGPLKVLPDRYYMDEGVKRITVSVAWRDSGKKWKFVSLSGLKENPSRSIKEFKIEGYVTDSFGVAISSIQVRLLQDYAVSSTNVSGNYYQATVRAGTYTVRVTDSFSPIRFKGQKKDVYVGNDRPTATLNFVMERIKYGTVRSTFWWNPNPVISRVCGYKPRSDDGTHQEWVEIFNPTTWTWNAAQLNLHYYLNHSEEVWTGSTAELSTHTIQATYLRTDIPPQSYFLFANTGTLKIDGTDVFSDAVWSTAPGANTWWATTHFGRFDPSSLTPDLITTAGANLPNQTISPKNGGGGYLRLTYGPSYAYLDGVGWKGGENACVSPAAPINAEGSSPLTDLNGFGGPDCLGLEDGEQWIRYSSTDAWQETRDIGPAYDSDNNVRDWSKHTSNPLAGPAFQRFLPRNSLSGPVPVPYGRDGVARANRDGTGGDGGYTNSFVNDGMTLGSTQTIQNSVKKTNMYDTGVVSQTNPQWAEWVNSYISSGSQTLGMYVYRKTGSYEYHASTQALLSVVENATTTWQGVVNSATDNVFYSGQILDHFFLPLENIPVELYLGGISKMMVLSGLQGQYAFFYDALAPTQTPTLWANNDAGLKNPNYSNGSAVGPTLWGGEGMKATLRVGNFGTLAGLIKDQDTGTPIPDVVVSAINVLTREEVNSGRSNGSGNFSIKVTTGTYWVKPIPEGEEVATPETATVTLATHGLNVFVATYTITSGYGTRAGQVTEGGQPIKSGVLLVLTTATIAGMTPPDMSSVVRSGPTRYYMASSNGAGRYSFDVKKGTYNLYAFYPTFTNGTVSWTKQVKAAQVINSGTNSDFADFTW